MTIKEVFPNPTVKQVIFQIRFPNLFSMENKIGDFQLKIMKQFPESALLYRRQVIFADVGPKVKIEESEAQAHQEAGKKIWHFESRKNFELNVTSDSLDINSRYHKTYKLKGGERFRDIIKSAVDSFLQVTSIPVVNRIGLRYIDECPIPKKDNKTFRSYYNSVFPLDRFSLADAKELDFKTVVRRGPYYLRYIESLQTVGDVSKLILDFDGFAENVASEDYLKVTDSLHKIISEEYEQTINDPVYKFMRKGKGS